MCNMVLRVVTKFFGCVTFMLYNIFLKTLIMRIISEVCSR